MNSFLSEDIINYADDTLKTPSVEIDVIDDSIIALARHLQKKMKEHNCRSISAIQIGMPLQIIVVDNKEKNSLLMINPKVIRYENEYTSSLEQCVSIESVSIKVTRPRIIEVEYLDLEGNIIRTQAIDDTARLILHEIDHLNGRTFLDKIESEEERQETLTKYYNYMESKRKSLLPVQN